MRTARRARRWLLRLALLAVAVWAARSAATVTGLAPQLATPQPPPGGCHASGSGAFALPDPRCTPGAVNTAVTQRSIAMTICHKGWTASVRAPERVTEAEKRASMAAYGDGGPLRRYEYDHLIPLELGGAVNDPHNLWPEPGASPNLKDKLEQTLNALVCREDMTLPSAQRLIAANWVKAYRRYVSRPLGSASSR